jgi:hypothetical protein
MTTMTMCGLQPVGYRLALLRVAAIGCTILALLACAAGVAGWFLPAG